MTNEQLRIALVANAVTRSNRIGFDFQDPAGKTLDEYTKEAMMQCVRVAQKMRQPGLDKELAGQVFPIYTIGNWAREKVVYDFDKDFQELLMDTDDIVIHHEILERLAFKDFYLPLYDSKDYCGMFVHIEFEPKTKDTFIGIVLVGGVANEKENYAFLSLPAWIKEGQTLTEATRSTKQYIENAANQRSTPMWQSPIRWRRFLLSTTRARRMCALRCSAPTTLRAKVPMYTLILSRKRTVSRLCSRARHRGSMSRSLR